VVSRIQKITRQPSTSVPLSQLNQQQALREDPMATAKELLLAYMDLIRNPDEAISLFAVDAAIEIPYLVEVGLPGQFKGHEETATFGRSCLSTGFPMNGWTTNAIQIACRCA
jgi:hypothetical protein